MSVGSSIWSRKVGTASGCTSAARLLAHGTSAGRTMNSSSAHINGTARLTPRSTLNFTALKLGRPHHMLFGSTKMGADLNRSSSSSFSSFVLDARLWATDPAALN